MMNILHLLWIVLLSATFGFVICAVLTVGTSSDRICAKAEDDGS